MEGGWVAEARSEERILLTFIIIVNVTQLRYAKSNEKYLPLTLTERYLYKIYNVVGCLFIFISNCLFIK